MSENQKHRKLSYKYYLIYLVEYFVPSSKKKFKRFLKLSQILPRRSNFFGKSYINNCFDGNSCFRASYELHGQIGGDKYHNY